MLALVDFEVDRFAALVAVSCTWRTDTREVWIKVGFWAHLSVMAVEKQVAVIPDCKAGCCDAVALLALVAEGNTLQKWVVHFASIAQKD